MLAATDANQERAEFAVSGRPTADDDLVACPALSFGPAVGSAGAIGRIEPFRSDALKRQPASGLQNRIASGFQMLDKANSARVRGAMILQQGLKPCLAIGKRSWSQVGFRLRPRQSLLRMSAAKDDEIVGVRDDVCAASRKAPMLQETVYVNNGEQRAHHATLRRAALAVRAAAHAPRPVAIPLFDRCLQPQLDQPQHMPVNDASGHRFEEVRMRNRVEIFRQISVNHVGVARCVSLTASTALRRGPLTRPSGGSLAGPCGAKKKRTREIAVKSSRTRLYALGGYAGGYAPGLYRGRDSLTSLREAACWNGVWNTDDPWEGDVPNDLKIRLESLREAEATRLQRLLALKRMGASLEYDDGRKLDELLEEAKTAIRNLDQSINELGKAS